jgi:hypothetical protein
MTMDAKHAHQLELEKLYSKNQTLPRIRQEFIDCPEIDFTGFFEANDISPKFGFDLLAQMALHKRCPLPTLVNILRHHLEGNCQATADLLLKCAELDLVDWDPALQLFVVVFTLAQSVQDELDLYQYPLPMVVEPQRLESNTDSGYLTGGGSVILRHNHHEDDVCLDHLNRMNRIRFSLDLDTASMVKLKWKGLDKQNEDETREDFEKRKKAFSKYKRTTQQVMDTLLVHGNEFYLTHKYDKRGRIYCQGYHVNYQGAPWNKAVIQLADKEYVE